MVNHPHRKQRAKTQARNTGPKRSPKTTECFLGVLYPGKQLLWNVGGPIPDEAIAQAVFIVNRPEFWDGIETMTTNEFARAAGRLVDVLVADKEDKRHGRLINVLALAVLGMSQQKFFWLKVETPTITPNIPTGKKLEAGFMLAPKLLSATTAKAARREFFDVTEVGLAAGKMWLMSPHEGELFIKEARSRESRG